MISLSRFQPDIQSESSEISALKIPNPDLAGCRARVELCVAMCRGELSSELGSPDRQMHKSPDTHPLSHFPGGHGEERFGEVKESTEIRS